MKQSLVEREKALLQFHLHLQILYNLVFQAELYMRLLFFQLHYILRLYKDLALIKLLRSKNTTISCDTRLLHYFSLHEFDTLIKKMYFTDS